MHWLGEAHGVSATMKTLQLDIVGFLAILGEGSVLANAQISTLSKWIFLPRLLPAPQALMRPSRPDKLEPHPGTVTGVWSGNHRPTINHIGNIVWWASSSQTPAARSLTRSAVTATPCRSSRCASSRSSACLPSP